MTSRPNIVFIMSDDHAAHAISAYGSRINETPNIDRIATGGMRLDAAFCTNSICAPSRAAILTGTYNHVNGVTTLDTPLDNTLWTFPKQLQEAGWQTALFGKWHLGHGSAAEPTGFDQWRVLPGQGHYHNPVFVDSEHGIDEVGGYVTDLITDDCLNWLEQRDADAPFALFCHHKAPHRTWEPDAKHFTMYDDVEIPFPDTFRDDLVGRAEVVQSVKMRMLDLDPIVDLKAVVPPGLTLDEEIDWRYQRYIKDYLRVVASIDDNVGRMLDWLEQNGLSDNTIVVEGNHYFPPESVDSSLVSSSDAHTRCPWKGTADYYDVVVDGNVNSGAAWFYPSPSPAASDIKNYVAFWRGVKVTS